MTPEVEAAIRRFSSCDPEEYLQRCQSRLDVVEQVVELAARFASTAIPRPDAVWPAREIHMAFEPTSREQFEAEFDSEVVVSKLVPVFHIQHSFTVENRHRAPVAASLGGFGNAGYIVPQFEMHRAVAARLVEAGFAELDLADVDEVIPWLSFPDGVVAFGRQVSVRHALFHDLRELCPSD